MTASPAALATAARRPARTQPRTIQVTPKPEPEGAIRLTAKGSLKVVAVLDPVQLAAVTLPMGAAAPPLIVEAGGRRYRASVNTKGLRRALAVIAEHGAENVSAILQGRLADGGDEIVEAGLVAMPRRARSEAPAA